MAQRDPMDALGVRADPSTSVRLTLLEHVARVDSLLSGLEAVVDELAELERRLAATAARMGASEAASSDVSLSDDIQPEDFGRGSR